jgi:hypothetical protein
LDAREEPGYLHGYGIVPAAWIRRLIATLPPQTQAWLRRILVTRDQICRTPFCGAPIRHGDHPTGHAHGGPTSTSNSQGLCEACNYTKQAPGWNARTIPGPRHTVRTTTPTGHHYDSTAPPLPGHYPAAVGPPPDPDTLPQDPLSPTELETLWAHLDQYAA